MMAVVSVVLSVGFNIRVFFIDAQVKLVELINYSSDFTRLCYDNLPDKKHNKDFKKNI